MDIEEWRRECRRFASEVIAPHVRRCDEERVFPWEVHERAAAEGMCDVGFPEEFGGRGVSHQGVCVYLEELCAVCPAIAWTLIFNHGALHPVMIAGTPEQKEVFVKQLLTRRGHASLCLTEPDTGSNLLAIKTRAINCEGGWLLNGEKCMVANGTVADTYLVLADTVVDRRRRGLSFFAVPHSAEVEVGVPTVKTGFRCLPTPNVRFTNVQLPHAHLIGAIGDGERVLTGVLDTIRLGGAAVGLGTVLGALRDVLPFVSQRRVYPDDLLIEKSHVQLLLGRIYTELQGARCLLDRALTLAAAEAAFGTEAAMAKYAATDLAVRATSEIVQLYGWRGIDADYGAEKRFRDARITTIYEGSSELQLLLAFRDLRRRIGEGGSL